MSLVLDNSVSMRWCFNDGSAADISYAEAVMDAMTTCDAQVPVIWPLEVANVMARAEHHGQIDTDHSTRFLALLRRLPIVTDAVSADKALTSTLELARAHDLSSYDAAYLELSRRLHLPLASLDADLRTAATEAGIPLFQPEPTVR